MSLATRRWLSSGILALGFGLGNTFTLPFQHEFAFELRDGTEKVQHKLAGWRGGVKIHGKDAKANALIA